MKTKQLFPRLFLSVSMLFLLTFEISQVHAANLLQQRWHFKEAYQAILKPDQQTFVELSARLNDYPIVYYLRFFYLKSNIATAEPATIRAFLTQYQTSHLASSLRSAWLRHLGQEKKWSLFLAFYTPQENTVLQCYHLQARLAAQDKNGWVEAAKKLWLVGKSQPNACDPVFDFLYKNDLVNEELRWRRLQLAMQNGHVGLARYLAKGLGSTYKKWATRWQAVHKAPLQELKSFDLTDSPIAREIIGYGLKRLARKDADQAYRLWQQEFKRRYAFSSTESNELLRYIALKAVQQNLFQAANWFAEIDPAFMTPAVYQAQLQIVLAQQDWQAVFNLVEALPKHEQNEEKWQYWQARALEQTGKTELAETRYQSVAQHRHYYGFLAADRLGKPYTFHPQSSIVSQKEKDQLIDKYSGLVRARELYFVGLTAHARQEWQAQLSQFSLAEKKIAAALAHQWGWHDRAIATIYQAKQYDDLDIRFPMPFYDIVLTHAQKQGLNYAWVYAVMRQESAFQTDAVSVAGASGLMQLMPATAKETAAKHGIEFNNLDELFTPDINIELGTAHLRDLLNRFNDNYFLVTAAYNAGASRVKQWLKTYGCLAPDIWIELIPFNQTRDYTQRVLSYLPIFEFQVLKKPRAVKPMPLDAIEADDC
jgi:soluble lytic murein transglycosylase